MTTADRENAVLSSFLHADDGEEDTSKAFKLSEDAFTSSFRKRVAIKINATTQTDKAYAFLSYELENSVEDTIFEAEWINILDQRPLPFSLAIRYHDDIRKLYNQRDGDKI